MYMYFSTPIPFGQYYLISDTLNKKLKAERKVAAEKKRQEQACVKAEKAAEKACAAEARKAAQDHKKAEKRAQSGKRKASSIPKPKAKRQKQSGGSAVAAEVELPEPVAPVRSTRSGRTTKLPSKYTRK
jgi:hypothetical protein